MFENIFTPSPLMWTGLIAGMIGIPILIHLINLMRHRRVKWAAMEFLLKSHQKNRNKVWFRQLLLLLSRITALLLTLFLLGNVSCSEDRVARLLGGSTTHHYVLVDDSFSMSDSGPDGSVMDNARAALSLIASRARGRQNQKFTLLRFSRATEARQNSGIGENNDSINGVADLNAEIVDSLFDGRLEKVRSSLRSTSLSSGIEDALLTAETLIRNEPQSNAIVYVLSDFRSRDWENIPAINERFQAIEKDGAAIELISCSDSIRRNLAVTVLQTSSGVRVAGTPLMMNITVRNFGDQPANRVRVDINTIMFGDDSGSDGSNDADVETLPTVFIEEILPGESETRQFPVVFPVAGKHVITAQLDEDAIAIDNRARAVIDFQPAARVLVIESPGSDDSRALTVALNPRGNMTGLSVEVRTRDFLRDLDSSSLLPYDVVYLLDVDRLDESAVTALETYVSGGGGVFFFAGPNVNLSFYNEWLFRRGEGLFPVPLEKRLDVEEQLEQPVADIQAVAHEIFPEGLRGRLLSIVQIKSMLKVPGTWSSEDDANVSVLATLRGQSSHPLIVQRRFGRGTVLASLTSAGRQWTNWSTNGTFPPCMLLAEDFLAAGRFEPGRYLAGHRFDFSLPASQYGPDVTTVIPATDGNDDGRRTSFEQSMKLTELRDAYRMDGSENYAVDPGIYDFWLNRSDGSRECRRFPVNVDTQESEMAIADAPAVLKSLAGSSPVFSTWRNFDPDPQQGASSSLAVFLLLLLLAFFVIEQILAYQCSYHAKPTASTATASSASPPGVHGSRSRSTAMARTANPG